MWRASKSTLASVDSVRRVVFVHRTGTGTGPVPVDLCDYIEDDDPRAAWGSPAAVLDACLDDAQLEEEEELALADIPAKLPWKVDA